MQPLYVVGKTLVQPVFKLLYPTQCIGKSRKSFLKPAILTANHFTLIDGLVVGVAHPRQVHFLSKKEAWSNKFMGWLLRNLGAIPVDRGKADIGAVKDVLKRLKNNKTIGIFPEGTRNKTGTDIMKISGGAALFAIKTQTPIVPMIIWRKSRLFRRNILLVGDALYLKEFYGQRINSETLAKANAVLLDKMLEVKQLLDYYVTLPGKQKRELKKELKDFRMPFSELFKKYRHNFPELSTTIQVDE